MTTPQVGEIRIVYGYRFEVLEVYPEPSVEEGGSPIRVRLGGGIFKGKALDASLVGTGYDGGNYSY